MNVIEAFFFCVGVGLNVVAVAAAIYLAVRKIQKEKK